MDSFNLCDLMPITQTKTEQKEEQQQSISNNNTNINISYINITNNKSDNINNNCNNFNINSNNIDNSTIINNNNSSLTIPQNSLALTENENEDYSELENFLETIKNGLYKYFHSKEILNNTIKKIIRNNDDISKTLQIIIDNYGDTLLAFSNPIKYLPNGTIYQKNAEITNTSPLINFGQKKYMNFQNNFNNNNLNNENEKLYSANLKISNDHLFDKCEGNLTLNDLNLNNNEIKHFLKILEKLKIKKPFEKLMAKRTKVKLKNEFNVVKESKGSYIFIPDENGNKYKYSFLSTSNNYMYLKCNDQNCEGKGKLDLKNKSLIIRVNHNIPFEKHNYN